MENKLIELQEDLIDFVQKELKESTSENLGKDISEVVRTIIELEKVIRPY